MTRLDYYAALKVAHECDKATAAQLDEAHRQLRSDVHLAEIAMKRIDDEFVRRVNARRVREMISELPEEQREVPQLKGMI